MKNNVNAYRQRESSSHGYKVTALLPPFKLSAKTPQISPDLRCVRNVALSRASGHASNKMSRHSKADLRSSNPSSIYSSRRKEGGPVFGISTSNWGEAQEHLPTYMTRR